LKFAFLRRRGLSQTVKDANEPVSPDEIVYRKVLNRQDYFQPSLASPVIYAAFRPTDSDEDGISVCRPACGATPEEVAAGDNYVAGLPVSDITSLDIEGLRPTVIPTAGDCRGHASIPELNVRLRDGSKKQYRLLAQRLAEIAGRNIVHRPVK
jgi:hypothetical protein